MCSKFTALLVSRHSQLWHLTSSHARKIAKGVFTCSPKLIRKKGGLRKKVAGIHTVLDRWQEERKRTQAPAEAESIALLEEEQDIAYHSRYGRS